MCSKWNADTMREVGIIGYHKCTKPDYKDGLCKYHYSRRIAKLVNWEDRPNYVEPSLLDFLNGKTLKLKETHTHKLYKYINKHVYQYNIHSYKYDILTNLSVSPRIFAIHI